MTMEKYINKYTFTSFTGGMLLGIALPQQFTLKDEKPRHMKGNQDNHCNCYSSWSISDDMVYAVVSGIL